MGHAYISQLRRWDVIAQLCASINASTYVEVGCKEGRTTGFVLDKLPNLRAVAIDPWLPQEGSADPTRETYKDWDFSAIEAEFWKNVGANKERCRQVRGTSAEFADECHNDQGMPREYFDVVFIDALHDYESVRDDIHRWWPLVKQGGFLTGHDFNHKWPGVMRAVSDSFNLMEVQVAPDSVWIVRKTSGGVTHAG